MIYRKGPFGWREFESNKAERIQLIKEEKQMMEQELRKYHIIEKREQDKKRAMGVR